MPYLHGVISIAAIFSARAVGFDAFPVVNAIFADESESANVVIVLFIGICL